MTGKHSNVLTTREYLLLGINQVDESHYQHIMTGEPMQQAVDVMYHIHKNTMHHKLYNR